MKIWWLKHEISKRKPCKPLSTTKSVCVSKNRLISKLPWLSTWATAWRCPRVVHTAALCLRCRRTGRSVCPAGRGSRRASGCSSASDPVKSEPEYLGLSQQEKEEYSPIWLNVMRPTSSLTSRAEHCRGTDIILCGFHVTELALKLTKTNQRFVTLNPRQLPTLI